MFGSIGLTNASQFILNEREKMAEKLLTELETLAERYYSKGDYTSKGPTYLSSYARLMNERRFDKLRILELGVFSGASLLIWRA